MEWQQRGWFCRYGRCQSTRLCSAEGAIIEDDEKVAQALAIRMEAAGYETIMANDGVSAVRAAVNGRPDVVVLDYFFASGGRFCGGRKDSGAYFPIHPHHLFNG